MDERFSRREEPPSAPSSRTRPSVPPPPASTTKPTRVRPTAQQVADALRELYPAELAEVMRCIDRMRATRGAATDPTVLSLVLSELLRLLPFYPNASGVPVSRVRAELPKVLGTVLDRALLDAEEQGFLRLLPADVSAPFIEPGAGIATARGLLYFIAPALR